MTRYPAWDTPTLDRAAEHGCLDEDVATGDPTVCLTCMLDDPPIATRETNPQLWDTLTTQAHTTEHAIRAQYPDPSSTDLDADAEPDTT